MTSLALYPADDDGSYYDDWYAGDDALTPADLLDFSVAFPGLPEVPDLAEWQSDRQGEGDELLAKGDEAAYAAWKIDLWRQWEELSAQ